MIKLPETAVFEITYACNHACLFCSCPWEEPGAIRGREMSVADWQSAASEWISHGVRNVVLSGGEPLLKEGVEDLLLFLASELYKVHGMSHELQFFSNGTLVAGETLRLLKSCSAVFSTSLPSIFDYKRQTGTGYDFRTVLKQVCAASEMGIRTSVGIALTRTVLPELYEILSYAFLCGAGTVMLNPFRPSGRGSMHPEFLLTKEDIQQALSTAEEVCQTSKGAVWIGGEYSPALVDPAMFPHLHFSTNCPAGKNLLVISPDGMVRGCEHDSRTLCRWNEWRTLENNPLWQEFCCDDRPVCPLFPDKGSN